VKNWDYNNIDGDFWNDKPHDEQLRLLEKYYPIGFKFHYIQEYLPGQINCRFDASKYLCEIVSYEIVGVAHDSGWYNLRIRNIGEELIGLRREEYETIHIGFFYPDLLFFRNDKLEQILGI
jgi:hypothetical protein